MLPHKFFNYFPVFINKYHARINSKKRLFLSLPEFPIMHLQYNNLLINQFSIRYFDYDESYCLTILNMSFSYQSSRLRVLLKLISKKK